MRLPISCNRCLKRLFEVCKRSARITTPQEIVPDLGFLISYVTRRAGMLNGSHYPVQRARVFKALPKVYSHKIAEERGHSIFGRSG